MPSNTEFFTIPPLSYFSPPRSELPAQPVAEAPAELDAADAKLENLVAARTMELRQAIGALEAARDEEKRALARQLHDDLGSALTALNIHLAILFRKMPDDPALVARSVQVNALLSSIAQTVHRIQNDVRPDKLDVFGIKVAVAEHALEFERRTGVACRVDLPDEELSYSPQVEIALFQILQNVLNEIEADNIATHVDVVLDDTDDGVVLSIRDNGAMRCVQRSMHRSRQELTNIRERVACLGGKMKVFNFLGDFTRVVVALPRTTRDVAVRAGAGGEPRPGNTME